MSMNNNYNKWGGGRRSAAASSGSNSPWSGQQRRPPGGEGGRRNQPRPINNFDDFDYNDNDEDFDNDNDNYYDYYNPQSRQYNNDRRGRRMPPPPPPLPSSLPTMNENKYDEFDIQQREYRQSTFNRDPWWPQQKQPSQSNNRGQMMRQERGRIRGTRDVEFNNDDWGFASTDFMQDDSFYDSSSNINTRKRQSRRERDIREDIITYLDDSGSGGRKKKQYTEDFRRGGSTSSSTTSSSTFMSTPPSWSFERNIPTPSSFRRQGMSSSSSSSNMVIGEQYTPNFRRGSKNYENQFGGIGGGRGEFRDDEDDDDYDTSSDWQPPPTIDRRWEDKAIDNGGSTTFRYPQPRPPIPPSTQAPPPKRQQNSNNGMLYREERRQEQRVGRYYDGDEPSKRMNDSYFGGRQQQQLSTTSSNERERFDDFERRQQFQQQQQQFKSPGRNISNFSDGYKSTRRDRNAFEQRQPPMYETGTNQQYNQQSQSQQYYKGMPPRSKRNTGIDSSTNNNEPSFANGGIKRMINKLFDPNKKSVFGVDKMMYRVDSELTRSIEEDKMRIKSLLTDARKYLLADSAVRNMLGSDSMELGAPISKTSSSTMVNGMTRSRLQLVIPVTGSSGVTGRIRIVANQDGITQLECDVGGRIIDVPLDRNGRPDSVIDASVVARDVY